MSELTYEEAYHHLYVDPQCDKMGCIKEANGAPESCFEKYHRVVMNGETK